MIIIVERVHKLTSGIQIYEGHYKKYYKVY